MDYVNNSIREIIELTKGEYASSEFEKFFNKVNEHENTKKIKESY